MKFSSTWRGVVLFAGAVNAVAQPCGRSVESPFNGSTCHLREDYR